MQYPATPTGAGGIIQKGSNFMAVSSALLQQLYLAYFGRPADFSGVQYYGSGTWDIWQVARAFSASPESQALYGSDYGDAVIQAIYRNIFNRDAEPEGLLYWSQQVSSGALTPGEVALAILLGAQNEDAAIIANKLAIASVFTAHVDTAEEIDAYAGAWAAGIARDFVATVVAGSLSYTQALGDVDPTIALIVGLKGDRPGGPASSGGGTIELTIKDPNYTAPDATTVDTVTGYVDNDGNHDNSTFRDGTTIVGNGHTIVDITLKDITGGMPTVQMSDIDELHFINEAGSGTAWFEDSSGWKDITNITLTGQDGLTLKFDTLDNDGPLTVGFAPDTAGTIDLRGPGHISIGDFNVEGRLVNSDQDAVAAQATFDLAAVDLQLGAADAAFSMYFSRSNSYQPAGVGAVLGDATIGSVSIHAGRSAIVDSFGIGQSANADHAAVTVGDLDIGAVSIDAAQDAAGLLFFFNESGYFNRTNTSATVGDLVLASAAISTAPGVRAELLVRDRAVANDAGDALAGDLHLGPISANGSGSLSLQMHSTAIAESGHASVGEITLASLALDGVSGSFELYNEAGTSSGAIAEAGGIEIGDVTIDSQNGPIAVLVKSTASGAVGSACGAVTVGDYALTLSGTDANTGAGAQATLSVETGTAGGSGGPIIVGDITIGTAGVSALALMTAPMFASVSLVSTDGPVSVGTITVGPGGFTGAGLGSAIDNLGDLSGWFHASGTTVTIGDVDYGAYSGAATIDVSHYAGAGTIVGAQGGNDIVDNLGRNVVDLFASTAKADTVTFQLVQSGVSDSGGAVTASILSIDTVAGMAAGDAITLQGGIANDVVTEAGTLATYAVFLVNAETQVTTGGHAAYIAVVGDSTYVALNTGGHVGEIVRVMGTSHAFTWINDSLVAQG